MFESLSSHAHGRRLNVLVMHEEPLLCAGISATLRDHADFEVFVHGADAPGADTPPIDVVVTDYGNGLRLADGTARASQPSLSAAAILVLTPNDREADIRRAIVAGVQGYLLLGADPAELTAGVAAVARGTRYLGRPVALRMADSLTRAELTSRESEVLQLVADGESNKGIARQLRIEIGTVKSHMSAIMGKLGATSRTHAASIASMRGLVKERALA
jgi:DNA-binding NarL/FixJ family response regulator